MKLKLITLLLLLGVIKMSAQFPSMGTHKHLVLLIDFPDKPAPSQITNAMVDQFFNVSNPSGGISFKAFYQNESKDKFGQPQLTVNSTVVGWLRMPKNYSEYQNEVEISKAAIALADPLVNYADYVIPNIGKVPVVTILTYGAISGIAFYVNANADGVNIQQSSLCNIGSPTNFRSKAIFHEFGHGFGLPDTYFQNDQYMSAKYDLMTSDSNYYTLSMVHKVTLGWVIPTELTQAGNYTLKNMEQVPEAYKISTSSPSEYYILECRKGTDTVNGMLIWHVAGGGGILPPYLYNVSVPGSTNYYEPILNDTNSTQGNKVFTSGSFTDFTKNWARTWNDLHNDKPITNISINSSTGYASFDFMRIPNMRILNATGVSASGAVLKGKANAADGVATDAYFQYSTDSSFPSTTATVTVSAGTIAASQVNLLDISAPTLTLSANTTYYCRVKTVRSGTAYYSDAKTFNTTVLSLPTSQLFSSSVYPPGWSETITLTSGTPISSHWIVSNTNQAGGTANEMSNTQGVRTGTARFISPMINTTGMSQLNLSFKYRGAPYQHSQNAYSFKVQTSTNGIDWSDSGWSYSKTYSQASSVGPATANVTLNVNTPGIYIAFVMEGNLFDCGAWKFDDVAVTSNGTPTCALPTATTVAASPVGPTSATLKGTVNAQNCSTTVTFEWGTTTSYGNTVSAGTVTGSTNTPVSAPLTNLTTGTQYHYRVKTVNAGGTVYGTDLTFTPTCALPTAITVAANPVGSTSATLNGTVNAQGCSTTVTFEWGTTTSYGNIASAGTVTGSANTNVSAPLTNLIAGTPYHYRVKAVSAGGTVFGADLTFTPTATSSYCAANGTANSTKYIDLVTFGGINRTSVADTGGYVYYTSTSASVTAGSTPTLSFSQGNTGVSTWNIWIDFNRDNDFLDAGEKIISGLSTSGSGTNSYFITIPSTATNGTTRMRVHLGVVSGATVSPCGTIATGEVEDYNVTISGGTGRMLNNDVSVINNDTQLTKCILYPNPTKGLLNVQLPTNDPANLTIYNIAGQTLLRQSVINDNPVNVDRLTPGLYFMEISGTNYTDRLQFIKE